MSDNVRGPRSRLPWQCPDRKYHQKSDHDRQQEGVKDLCGDIQLNQVGDELRQRSRADDANHVRTWGNARSGTRRVTSAFMQLNHGLLRLVTS
jgi:hypothetical protein